MASEVLDRIGIGGGIHIVVPLGDVGAVEAELPVAPRGVRQLVAQRQVPALRIQAAEVHGRLGDEADLAVREAVDERAERAGVVRVARVEHGLGADRLNDTILVPASASAYCWKQSTPASANSTMRWLRPVRPTLPFERKKSGTERLPPHGGSK